MIHKDLLLNVLIKLKNINYFNNFCFNMFTFREEMDRLFILFSRKSALKFLWYSKFAWVSIQFPVT